MTFVNPDPEEIRALLAACRHVAVVGLSPRPERDSHRVALYLKRHGYTVTGVNPGHATLLGEPCYPSVAAIPAGRPIDLVNVFRRSDQVAGPVDEAIARGVRGVWLQFGVIDEAAAGRARAAGLTVVMDRCIRIDHGALFAAG